MNKSAELMDALKAKIGITSDYALAKKLGVNRARISAYRQGNEKPDFYICVKAGIFLNLDPVKIAAEIELEKEKNEERRGFWRDFLSQSTPAILIMLVSLCITFFGSVPSAEANNGGDSITAHYTKYEILSALLLIMPSDYLLPCNRLAISVLPLSIAQLQAVAPFSFLMPALA